MLKMRQAWCLAHAFLRAIESAVCGAIKNKRYQYTGTLLTEILRDEETLEYMIGLNESIAIFLNPPDSHKLTGRLGKRFVYSSWPNGCMDFMRPTLNHCQ